MKKSAKIRRFFEIPILLNIEHKVGSVFPILWTIVLLAIPAVQVSNIGFSKDAFFYGSFFTRNIPMTVYVKGKLYFTLIYSAIFYSIFLPIFFYFDKLVFITFLSGIFYYIGFGTALMLFVSSFDNHAIDLNSSAFLNYKGFSIIKILLTPPISIPLLLFPATRLWGIALMFIFGLGGLIFMNYAIRLITNNLKKRKYALLNIRLTNK